MSSPRLNALGMVATGVAVAAVGAIAAHGAQDIVTVIGGGVFGVIGLVFMGKGARELLAHAAFTRADLISIAPVKLGGTATVGLHLLAAKRALNMGPASKLVLECVEEAVYSAGTQSRTYTEVLHTETVPLDLPRLLDGDFTKDVTLRIPSHVAPSWNGTHNRFYTKVTVHLDIESWPDLTLETRIDVLPEYEP